MKKTKVAFEPRIKSITNVSQSLIYPNANPKMLNENFDIVNEISINLETLRK